MFPVETLVESHYEWDMETELAQNLLMLADRFCGARNLEETTVGRHCAADGRFFSRIREGKTFTAKKYDEVVQWFSTHWPADVSWPESVRRPPLILEAAE